MGSWHQLHDKTTLSDYGYRSTSCNDFLALSFTFFTGGPFSSPARRNLSPISSKLAASGLSFLACLRRQAGARAVAVAVTGAGAAAAAGFGSCLFLMFVAEKEEEVEAAAEEKDVGLAPHRPLAGGTPGFTALEPEPGSWDKRVGLGTPRATVRYANESKQALQDGWPAMSIVMDVGDCGREVSRTWRWEAQGDVRRSRRRCSRSGERWTSGS